MYFDAQERAPDPRHLAAYRGALSRLAGLTGELGQPLAEISALLSELERLPRSEEPLYPARLIALLGAHERLESQAAQHYRQLAAEVPAPVQLLHRQSQALGRLLLQAQARRARVLGAYSVALSAAQFAAVDEGINQGFAALLAALKEYAERLQKQQRSFRFVRGQLLSSDFGRSIASSEPYCPQHAGTRSAGGAEVVRRESLTALRGIEPLKTIGLGLVFELESESPRL